MPVNFAANLGATAHAVLPPVVRIHGITALETLGAHLSNNVFRGLSVDTFEVKIGCEYQLALEDLSLLRACLTCMPNLTDLHIILPSSPPSLLLEVLEAVELGRLELLNTNMPHSALTPFLRNARHRNIKAMILKDCGLRENCRLGKLSLHNVRDLECSLPCFPAIHAPYITRLSLRNDCTTRPTSLILGRVAPRMHLTHLTVEFFSGDLDILEKLLVFAPNLRKLRIVERVGTSRRGRISGRRVWKSIAEVSKALKKFVFLEEFMLDSTHDIVKRNGSEYSQERELIHGWLTGRRRAWLLPGSRASHHPKLHRISLLSGRARPCTQTMSVWMKDISGWDKVVDEFGRLADVVF